ncbi:BETA-GLUCURONOSYLTRANSFERASE GLCAT14B-LIKE [Salix koriyanagi]|uniref:BETA-GLUCURONOSYLTRANSFERASE GLCAT14B-LIKE n=1 Tax=Salix koriyanagi TaxID=2511006 RepID=A0A9Q0TQ42_9ROSI|nr:BETA-GLUCURONOSYLTRANSFERASE GLCAT14B-LIKE [Salix koriyanagi]
MENNKYLKLLPQQKKQKWLLLLMLSSTILLLTTIAPFSSSPQLLYKLHGNKYHFQQVPLFVEPKLENSPISPIHEVPRLAYLISGSAGDGVSLKRALKALYHPRNQYAVHLDLEATAEERVELARWVREEKVFAEVGNVRVVVRSNLVTYRGPTMVSNTLHAAAILLKDIDDGESWDWFINLSASDYPLMTQDDILHTLIDIPRDLNFIEHTSDIGWKKYQRAEPVIIDPGLHGQQKSEIFWISEKRRLPTAYNLFTGSAWMMLSRPFVEYCLWGWDNLPRIVLMYYANFLSSPEGYFHTVICNADEFRNTTVNHDLHFISWDSPPKQHPHFLTVEDYESMVESNVPFARKFGRDDPVLDRIDSDLLGRRADGFVPGGWLADEGNASTLLPRFNLKNTNELKPGPGARRLKRLMNSLLLADDFNSTRCKMMPVVSKTK